MEIPLILNSTDGITGSKSHDFTIQFDSTLDLDPNKKHYLALNTLNMSYSWYNISPFYKNTKIKYSPDGGTTWKNINFPKGNFSYRDINEYIHSILKKNGDMISKKEIGKSEDIYGINISFVAYFFKVYVELLGDYQIDLSNSNFGKLIGFEEKKIEQSSYSSKEPDITNSVDSLMLRCSLLSDSLVSGKSSDVLYQFSVDNLPLSYPFSIEPTLREIV